MGLRVGIIGFGFSGLMVLANTVKQLGDATFYVIAPDVSGLGLAYGTRNTQHLLNVPAGRMGAFADALDGFMQWQRTPDAALAKQRLKLNKEYTETDFVPRALYAAYLTSLWEQAQLDAAEQGCSIKLVEASATRIRHEGELAVLTDRGDAIAVDRIVLAVGNEAKAILPQMKSAQIIQNPWAKDVFADAAHWASPVLLVGAGLTAVDSVLSLRQAGYGGEILVCSRHGKWPLPHAPATAAFVFDKEALFAQKTLQQLLRYVRSKIHDVGEWRAVMDALRPHTQALWQRLGARDQQRFIRWLLPVWNIHRHRMAPEIFAVLGIAPLAIRGMDAVVKDAVLQVTVHTKEGAKSITPSRVINCAGGALQAAQSSNPLIKQALADGVIEVHPNGLGVAVDPHYRAWGAAHPQLYVIGTWMTGQLLESTAVPELRIQAQHIAQQLAEGQ